MVIGFLLTLVCLCDVGVESKNMDTSNVKILKGRNGSLFGYSLATHIPGAGHTDSLFLVGAPGENTEQESFSGAVYLCNVSSTNLTSANNCTNLHMPLSKDRSTEKWLGATVSSQDGMILACAPNFGHESPGKCFYSYNTMGELGFRGYSFEKSPHIGNWSDENLKMCVNGMSATLAKPVEDEKLRPTIVTSGAGCEHSAAKGVWIFRSDASESHLFCRNNALEFPGFALAVGIRRVETVNTTFLASSIGGRSLNSYAGMVQILEINDETKNVSKVLETLNGLQEGEYFGYSLAVFDLNGDDRDDLIVGAPIHSRYSDETEYEIGAVYILYQSANGKFNESIPKTSLFGKAIGSRFGFAIAGLEDTNGDNFNDLAVGAPYENNGLGAIYIYHGSEEGIANTYAQIIRGQQFDYPLRTFGWSFASADFDGNGYGDVIVGAPQSNAAVYIRSRPLVTINTSIDFEPRTVTFLDARCSRSRQSEYQRTCAEIKYCLSLSGKLKASVEEIPIQLTIKLGVNGTSFGGKSSHPFTFAGGNSAILRQNVSLWPDTPKCLRQDLKADDKFSYGNLVLSASLEVSVGPENPGLLLPLIKDIVKSRSSSTMEVHYVVTPARSVAQLPWWIYLACGLGAFLIILIITGILYKLGFFKRIKPPGQAQEPTQELI